MSTFKEESSTEFSDLVKTKELFRQKLFNGLNF